MAAAEVERHKPLCPDEVLPQAKTISEKISGRKSEDTEDLFKDVHEMAILYYRGALYQADRSFITAQCFAGLAVVFVLGGGLWMVRQQYKYSEVSGIVGAIASAVSFLNFHLYRQATKQFELFHICLERMGRYLMANSICANIDDAERRDEARSQLVATMAHAPLLPLEWLREDKHNEAQQTMAAPIKSAASAAAA